MDITCTLLLHLYLLCNSSTPTFFPIFFFFFLKFLFIFFWLCWVFISARGLSPVVASGGHSSSRCVGLSLSRPLLLRSTGSRRAGSVTVAHGPSCSTARGIFPDQGSNPCPLHWQADSQPLRHQGSPSPSFMLSSMPLYWIWILLKILSFSKNALLSPYAKWNLRILQGHQKDPALGGWSFLYTRQTEETGEIVSILLAPYCFFQNIIPSHWDLLPTSALPHYCHLLTFWSLLLKSMGIWQMVSYKLALHSSFCQNLQGFQKVNTSYQVAA